MEVENKIPEYLGKNELEEDVFWDSFRGRKLILYFYPKDNTAGCTAEACSFRDHYEELRDAGFEVLGVSADGIASHQKFVNSKQLPFHLIADSDRTLIEAMGAWGEKVMCGRKYMGILRTTFLIDENGKIIRKYLPKEIKTKIHAEQILKDYAQQ